LIAYKKSLTRELKLLSSPGKVLSVQLTLSEVSGIC